MAYFICCNFDIIDFLGDANLSTNYLEVLKFRAGWCKKILPLARPRQRELESHFNDKTSPSSRQRAVCCLSQIANNGRSFIPWPGICAKVSPDSAGWWVRTQFLILSWKYHTQLSSSHFRRYIILRNGWRYHIISDEFSEKFQTAKTALDVSKICLLRWQVRKMKMN